VGNLEGIELIYINTYSSCLHMGKGDPSFSCLGDPIVTRSNSNHKLAKEAILMFQRVMKLVMFLSIVLLVVPAQAAMESSGNVAPLMAGDNVVAGVAVNDSPGSSDLTLIVQLEVDGVVVFDEGDPIKAIMPTANIPSDADPTGWTKPGFDDSGWQDGTNGVGYGDGDDNTEIGDGNHATVYMRGIFTIANLNTISSLTLGVDYDDAAVVFINGVEVARTSGTDIPNKPEWDSWSDKGSGQSHEASKTDPPGYEAVELQFEISTTAVRPSSKLTTTWGALKE
jgi:hypothetical protein